MINPTNWPAFDWTTLKAPRDAFGRIRQADRKPDVVQNSFVPFVPSIGFMGDAPYALTLPLLVGAPEMQTTTFADDSLRHDELAGRSFTRRPAIRPDANPQPDRISDQIIDAVIGLVVVALIVAVTIATVSHRGVAP